MGKDEARGREAELAGLAAQLLRDHRVTGFPVDPIGIAEARDVAVQSMPLPDKMFGFIMQCGDNDYAIGYSNRLDSPGMKYFTIAHELGHYCIDGHPLALLPPGTLVHGCLPLQSGTPFEKEADCFASELLMPESWFREASDGVRVGLDGVHELARLCRTSLTATANRYAHLASVFCLSIMSDGRRVKYGFLSAAAKALIPHRNDRFLRERPVPENSATHRFNATPGSMLRAQGAGCLSAWLPAAPKIPVREEVQGLGRFGILTILTAQT